MLHCQKIGTLLVIAAAAWAAGAIPAQATLLVFTSRTQWEQAIGGPTQTEDFNALTPQQLPVGTSHLGKVDFFNERLSGNLIVAGSFVSTVNGTNCLRIEASKQNGSTPPFTPSLVFQQPVQSFGAEWYYGINGTMTVAGQLLKFEDYLSSSSRRGFLGVISTTPFTEAEFDTVTPFNMLVYADNVSFVTVPEPPAPLLAMMAGSVFWICRRIATVGKW